jgi:hypothetical protein
MTRTRVHIAASFALGATVAATLAYTAPRAAEAPILPPIPTAVDKAEAAPVATGELEACIPETVDLVGKTAKLRELRHADGIMQRAAQSGNGGLVAVVKGIAAPLEAEQKADRATARTRARLKNATADSCRVEWLWANQGWLCPFPDYDDPIYSHLLKEHDQCWDQWRASLAPGDAKLIETDMAVRSLGGAYAAADGVRR